MALGGSGIGVQTLVDGDPSPLSPCPVSLPFLSLVGAVEALDLKVCWLIKKGSVEEVLSQHLPIFYSWLFMVPKSSGGWHSVLDLSLLNLYLQRLKFKMETSRVLSDKETGHAQST